MRVNAGSAACHSGRRHALAMLGKAACGVALTAWLPAMAMAVARRVAVLDWGLTEIVLSLGVVPVGVSRPPWYQKLDGVPTLPPHVTDVGLLFQPNFEVLQSLRPELIIVNPMHAPLLPMLQRIAPTLTVDLYTPKNDAYANLRVQTRRLGELLGRGDAADTLLARAEATLLAAARRLSTTTARKRPIYLLKPIDGRHVTVYGTAGLFGGVLSRLGLRNAWQGSTDAQGQAETDLMAIAQAPQARAVLIGAQPPVLQALAASPLWQALPMVRQARTLEVPAFYPGGGLITAIHFAERLTDTLVGAAA